jgi:predicted AAA+ superfamily ATPase
MDLVPRPAYVSAIAPFIGQPIIKVLTGLRRCGKSSLLKLIAQELRARGVPDASIIMLDFESMELSSLLRADALHEYLVAHLPTEGLGYVLLDEIQEVEGWERVVNSLHATKDVDIYLTGSNSRLLSGELATYLAGRYVTTEVSTLSFAEYLAFRRQVSGGAAEPDVAAAFDDYVRRGGFPGLMSAQLDDVQHYRAVSDIYASALIQDAVSRHGIRNADMLRRVAAFALETVGSPLSASSIAAYFKSQRRSVAVDTVVSYLGVLNEAFILARVPRNDLQGKGLLSVNDKHYAGDHSLIHAVLGYDDRRLPGVLENIVGAELRRRGYQVSVGKVGDAEVDFVADHGSERLYVQVAVTVAASVETRERELAPLLAIRDSHPKLLLTLDRLAGGGPAGIQHRWLPDWLLEM